MNKQTASILTIIIVVVGSLAGVGYYSVFMQPATSGPATSESPDNATVEGILVKVLSVTIEETFSAGGVTYNPATSSDSFLYVQARIGSDTTADKYMTQVASWNVSVNDEKDRVSQPCLSVSFTNENETQIIPVVQWYFSVSETSNSFTLNLPEGQKIILTPFLLAPNPTVSNSPGPTTISSPAAKNEPWTISTILSVATAQNWTNGVYPNRILAYPSNDSDVFLFVRFELAFSSSKNVLDAHNVLVVVDRMREYHPVGGGGDWLTVGDSMKGNITSEETNLEITENFTVKTVDFQNEVGGGITYDFPVNSKELTFIYVLSRDYLEGSHFLQLKIFGSTSGMGFVVQPP